MEELWRSSRARALRHIRNTIMLKEVYHGPNVSTLTSNISIWRYHIGNKVLAGLPSIVSNSEKGILLFWCTAREVAITILTSALLGTMLCFLRKLFFIMKLKHLGTKTSFALKPSNPFYDYNQNLAEDREMKQEKSQLKEDFRMRSKKPAEWLRRWLKV